ncbi:MAG: GDSL-type esterase/lipase family protein [Eubacteriales bacterium]|nr:GDSL-type esterase/lipase family protein [Eubacteriales bacterium]
MDKKQMENDSKSIELLKVIDEQMRARGKQEQFEKAKNFQILNRNVVKGQILFTGSSLMEQFPITEIAQNHGINKIIYNRGIGGYTTDDFISEIDTVLFDLSPSKLFINIGTNDINEREDGEDWNRHLLTNYKFILNQIKERLPETEVYMMAYYPVNPTVADNEFISHMLKIRTNDNLNMVNGQVSELAQEFGFHFINANEGLCDENGNLKAEFTKEGLHMFANAYEIVFNNIKQYI